MVFPCFFTVFWLDFKIFFMVFNGFHGCFNGFFTRGLGAKEARGAGAAGDRALCGGGDGQGLPGRHAGGVPRVLRLLPKIYIAHIQDGDIYI